MIGRGCLPVRLALSPSQVTTPELRACAWLLLLTCSQVVSSWVLAKWLLVWVEAGSLHNYRGMAWWDVAQPY
jgi:hypothetical protein